jgi:hypothetical protein
MNVKERIDQIDKNNTQHADATITVLNYSIHIRALSNHGWVSRNSGENVGRVQTIKQGSKRGRKTRQTIC